MRAVAAVALVFAAPVAAGCRGVLGIEDLPDDRDSVFADSGRSGDTSETDSLGKPDTSTTEAGNEPPPTPTRWAARPITTPT